MSATRQYAPASAVKQALADGGVDLSDILVNDPGVSVWKAEQRGATASRGPVADIYSEIGTSGLKQYGGFVLEEWLTQLQGRKAAWVWREMGDNDPTIGAIFYTIRWLARGVDWRVEEGSDQAAAQLVEECMHDMSHTWGDFVSDVLSMLQYGWSLPEIVYKKRNGEQPDRTPRLEDLERSGSGAATSEDDRHPASSAYDDGKIGWRKMPIRAQETLLKWIFDGYSGLAGMTQIDWHGGYHNIPIQKALLFRTQTTRSNPEGRSVLRNAFTSYWALKSIKQFEGIGIERELAGIPVLTPPDNVDILSAGQAALYQKCRAMVTGVRRDEYHGIVLPSGGWKFELVHSGGSRQVDTDEVIRRYRQDIATSMLADFVLIGQDAVGSFAMVDVKADLFGVALDGILDLVCEVMNAYAIPRLLKLNGMDASDPPRIEHGSAGRINLERVGTFLFQLAGAGAPIPWTPSLLEALFLEAGLPAAFFDSKEPDEPMVPVGPPKLPAGQDPYAREAHAEPASEQPAPTNTPTDPSTGPTKPAKSTKSAKTKTKTKAAKGKRKGKTANPREPLAKADRERTRNGTVIHLAPQLRARLDVLAGQLEQDLNSALEQLAEQAATAYLTTLGKARRPQPAILQRIAARVTQALNLRGWVQQHLLPILRNHASRVMADTARTIQAEIQLEVGIGEQDARDITRLAGQSMFLLDIERQARLAILEAIRQGLANGDNPTRTARRIRELVPAGVFVHAGSKYRAQLIARTETSKLMLAAQAAAYQSNPHITAVRLRDGIYGPPRSCQACIARDGTEVPIHQAGTVRMLHPLCSLSLEPVVSGALRERATEPAPALA